VPLQCNIDARGKAIRLAYGSALVIGGLVLILTWARPTGGWAAWCVSLIAVLGGGFAVFEAAAGWCIVRAMGFKTRF